MKKQILMLLLATVVVFTVNGQDKEPVKSEGGNAAQANNPLANMTALNFQNYYIPKLTDAPADMYLNTTWIRFAKPFASGKLLLRASAPLSTVSAVAATTSGLGDLNAFLSYNFYSKPTGTLGVGPLLAAPTATDDVLGSGKWQGGLAFVAFFAKSPVIQFGGLITWQASFAGDDARNSTNLAAVQPFYFFQLGKGTYLRGAPIWAFDIENDAYHMPIALGIGKVLKVGSSVFNLFVEPQYSMLSNGTQPQLQIFTGINLQFLK